MPKRRPGDQPRRKRPSRAAQPLPADQEDDSQQEKPEEDVGLQFARVTVPRQLDDDEKRRQWDLPVKGSDALGAYIVELNAQHIDGLPGAENEFKLLYQQVIVEPGTGPKGGGRKKQSDASEAPPSERAPLKIAKTYYRCEFRDHEWRALVALDEQKPATERAVYRLWPDFPVKPHTTRSMVTIKADAALRSFDAAGEEIVWAVIDSGIDANHPHFGRDGDEHALRAKNVVGLHRCFANIIEMQDGIPIDRGPLPSPDWDPNMDAEKRKSLIEKHRHAALADPYGHGTHVAGIIAGQAPDGEDASICILEHEYKVDQEGNKLTQGFGKQISTGPKRPRGVAPRCKLISLRILDHQGKGRSSQVIQALEYIREKVNDNPKLMRVHGINLSVGYEFDAEMFACGQSPLCTAVDRLVQEGVVVVSAAGNTGYGQVAAAVGTSRSGLSNTINDPGNAALTITVGSTHRDAPHTYGVSYFSSKGPTGDGRLKPDLVAPGERITSCAAGTKLDEALRTSGGSKDGGAAYYMDDSGTSMAAPHVSGAIAAFLSIRREFIGKPQEVKRIFLESATPLGRERYFEGHGLVDLMRAIQSV